MCDSSIKSDRGSTVQPWHLLLAVMFVAVPMFMLPGRRNDMNSMERLAILTAEETWIRQHEGDSTAWLLPSLNEQPRLRKPPLTTWLYMLAWSDLDPQTARAEQLIGRTHLISAGLGVVMIASCGWIGCVLIDRRVGLLGILALGSMWFVERQARMASYDIHVAAWAALSIAAGLWAMRPFAPAPTVARVVVGTLLFTVAFWASWMSKNPLTLLYVLPALVMVPILDRNRRWRHVALIVGIAGVGAALTQPWYWYVDAHVPDAPAIRALEYKNLRPEYQGPFYYLALIGLVAPWSIWFVGGVLNPWIRSAGTARRRALVIWFWFAIVFAVMSAYPTKQQRYILSLTPAAALLCAMVLRDDQHEADTATLNRRARVVGAVHWIALLLASVGLAAALSQVERMIRWRWMDDAVLEPLPLWAAATIAIVLAFIAILGFRAHQRGRSVFSGVLTGVWGVLVLSVVWWSYTTAPAATNPSWNPAIDVRRIVHTQPVYWLNTPDSGIPLCEAFRLYAVRRIPSITPRELRSTVESSGGQPVFVVTLDNDDQPKEMTTRGWVRLLAFEDEPGVKRILWQSPGSTS